MIAQSRWPDYLLLSRDHKTDLLECDDDGLSFTQEYIILYLRNIADSQIFWQTPKFSNLGVLLTPKKSGSKSTPDKCMFYVLPVLLYRIFTSVCSIHVLTLYRIFTCVCPFMTLQLIWTGEPLPTE